jgi:hypothetical protein
MALLRITVATQAELLEGLAAGREDDDSTDFWGCIDASDTGRRQALVVLNEYIMRKTKEERERVIMREPETQEQPIQRSAEQVQQAGQSLQAVRRENTMPALQLQRQPSEQRQDTSKPRRFSFFRSSSTVVESRSNQATRPAPTTVQSEEGSPSPLQARTLTGVTLVENGGRRTTSRRTSSPQRQSIASMHSFSQISPPGRTTSGSTSPRSASISESTLGAPSITSYGGCCKYAHHLRDGKIDKSLRRQNLAFSPGATSISFMCHSTKCSFQVPAYQNKKRDWIVDDRPRIWRRRLQYTSIFLAKSHLPTLVPPMEQKTKASYRCMMCIYSHERASVFYGQDALLEHVLGHGGAVLNGVTLEGPLSFSNDGVSISSEFDINLPKMEPDPGVQAVMSTHTDNTVADAQLQHELDKLEMNSKRSSNATQEMDPFYSPWAD